MVSPSPTLIRLKAAPAGWAGRTSNPRDELPRRALNLRRVWCRDSACRSGDPSDPRSPALLLAAGGSPGHAPRQSDRVSFWVVSRQASSVDTSRTDLTLTPAPGLEHQHVSA